MNLVSTKGEKVGEKEKKIPALYLVDV